MHYREAGINSDHNKNYKNVVFMTVMAITVIKDLRCTLYVTASQYMFGLI